MEFKSNIVEAVYFSYSQKDQEYVKRIATDLEKLNLDVWIDFRKVTGGANWVDVMAEGLEKADVFIVCLSQNAVQSEWVIRETKDAIEQGKRIIPIFLSDNRGIDFNILATHSYISKLTSRYIIVFRDDNYLQALNELIRAISPEPKIFISYRRVDSADVCDRVYEKLAAHFGKDNIVRDIDNIPLGIDFRHFLEGIIQQCVIALVLIGPKWLTVQDEGTGGNRLDNPADFVRIEIETALSRNMYVIPITVMGASIPFAAELPSNLSELVYRNGTYIRRDPDFQSDMERLIKELEAILLRFK